MPPPSNVYIVNHIRPISITENKGTKNNNRNSMAKVIPNRVFEEYDPPTDLVTEEGCDTLLIYLPGFKKEQLKVQLTISRALKISGECPLGDNKYRRFQKEFPLPSNCDTKDITAKFEGGILYIRQPKLITPAAPQPQPQPQQPQPLQPQQLAPPPPPPPPLQKQAPISPLLPPSLLQPSQTPLQQQSQQQDLKKELAKGRDEEARGEEKGKFVEGPMKKEKEEIGSRKEETKDDTEVIEKPRQVVNSGLFRELKKPDNIKRLGVCVIMVLIIGFYISYMFKSLMEDVQINLSEHEYVREL